MRCPPASIRSAACSVMKEQDTCDTHAGTSGPAAESPVQMTRSTWEGADAADAGSPNPPWAGEPQWGGIAGTKRVAAGGIAGTRSVSCGCSWMSPRPVMNDESSLQQTACGPSIESFQINQGPEKMRGLCAVNLFLTVKTVCTQTGTLPRQGAFRAVAVCTLGLSWRDVCSCGCGPQKQHLTVTEGATCRVCCGSGF